MRRAYDGAIGSGQSRVKQFAMISSSSTSSTSMHTVNRSSIKCTHAAGGTKNLSSVHLRFSIEIRQSLRKTERGVTSSAFSICFFVFSWEEKLVACCDYCLFREKTSDFSYFSLGRWSDPDVHGMREAHSVWVRQHHAPLIAGLVVG